jgi:cytochrome c biogenesis protein CcdA
MLEIYHNSTNQDLFFQMSRQYGIENPGIPELVIGNHMLVGDTEIKDHFEERIHEEQQNFPSCNSTVPATPVLPVAGCPPESTQLTVPLVIISAMVDSINPCAFSVLIFLLISLVAAGDRRRTLLVGSVYIAAVFTFYLLSGIGLFSAIHLTGLSFWLSLIGALVAIGLGLIGVIDTLTRKEGFILGIPESKKAVIEEYIKKASLPAAFTLGILVGIFELPCTGGIYLAILGLMSRDMTLIQGLPYLILYNIIFVLPLIIIVLIVTFGISPEKADAWRIRYRRPLRLVVALVMIAIGLIILLGWFR